MLLISQLGWDEIDDLLSPVNLKATAGSFPGKTSTGCDLAKLSWLSSLPLFIWKELSSIARQAVRLARAPSQIKPVLLFMLGKKGGGFRTIGVISSFMRIVMRALSPLLRNYDSLHSDPTDSATSGAGGAEFAAFVASAMDEIESRAGTVIVRIFWDIKKFFDSIRPDILVKDVLDGELPVVPVALALEVHGAPRFLGMLGSFEGPIGEFNRSVVAGCAPSTTLCRQFIKAPLLAARHEEPQSRIGNI